MWEGNQFLKQSALPFPPPMAPAVSALCRILHLCNFSTKGGRLACFLYATLLICKQPFAKQCQGTMHLQLWAHLPLQEILNYTGAGQRTVTFKPLPRKAGGVFKWGTADLTQPAQASPSPELRRVGCSDQPPPPPDP